MLKGSTSGSSGAGDVLRDDEYSLLMCESDQKDFRELISQSEEWLITRVLTYAQ